MPSNVSIAQFEPVVFLRGGTGRDARGRLRQLNTSAGPSQVRALLTLELQKACKIRDIQVSFTGLTHTDWPEGIGPNRLELAETTQIFKDIVTIWSAKDDHELARIRRRANSIGPGVDGAPGDEDWSSFSNAASAVDSPSPTAASHTASSGGESQTLARSIAGAAARAGTAIMPATIRNELASARKAQKSGSQAATASTSRSSGTQPGSAPIIMPRATSTSAIRALTGPGAIGEATPIARPISDILDPPPTYDEAATPPANSVEANRRSSYFDAATADTPSQGDMVQSPGILHRSSSRTHLRSPGSTPGPVVHFGSAIDEPIGTGNAATMTRVVDLVASNGQASSPSPASIRRNSAGSRPSSRDRPPNAANTPSGSTSNEARGRKAGSTLKSLIGGLLLAEKHEDDASNTDWKQFKAGVYQFPVTVQLPSDLPPTLYADFGHNSYHLRALVRRVGPLTSNLMAEREVTLIHSPEEDGTTDATDLIVVQRTWEDALAYMVVISGKTFPIKKSKIPLWMKLAPIDKVSIHRITASVEERTSYFAKGRFVARHEVPRRWQLLRLASENSSVPLLPILADDEDALERSPLLQRVPRDAEGKPDEDAASSLLDPTGPWELYLDLPLPTCSTSSINLSSSHVKSNIQVTHTLRVSLRVSRRSRSDSSTETTTGSGQANDSKTRQFDIIIEAPITLTHSQTAEEWVSLPNYWTLTSSSTARDDSGTTLMSSPSTQSPLDGSVMMRSASHGEQARNAPPSSPLRRSPTRERNPSPSQLSRAAYVPKAGVPSPVVMRTAGLSSSIAAQRTRSGMASLPSSSSFVNSVPGAEASPSSSGGAGAGSNSASAGASSAASSLTSTARELSRQWLALSSAGAHFGGAAGGGGGGGGVGGSFVGTGMPNGDAVWSGSVAAASGRGQGNNAPGSAALMSGLGGIAASSALEGGGPPPPDYHTVIEEEGR